MQQFTYLEDVELSKQALALGALHKRANHYNPSTAHKICRAVLAFVVQVRV